MHATVTGGDHWHGPEERAGGREVRREPVEGNNARVAARGVVDDRVEVHEGVVSGGVLVAGLGALGPVLAVERRVPAGLGLRGRVAHVLHVSAPRQALGPELVGDGPDRAGIDAAGRSDDLAIRGRHAG